MLLFLCVLTAIAVLSGAWYLHEHRWDRRLFGHGPGNYFVINVRARKAAGLWRDLNLVPIDVRPAPDFRAAHLPGAVNAPFTGSILDLAALEGLARDRPVLVYCDGGYRSRRSLPAIRAAGFSSVYHLHRGLLSWKMAKEPVEADPST